MFTLVFLEVSCPVLTPTLVTLKYSLSGYNVTSLDHWNMILDPNSSNIKSYDFL